MLNMHYIWIPIIAFFLMTIYDLRVLYSVCFWLKAKNGEKTSELPYERCSKNIYNFC